MNKLNYVNTITVGKKELGEDYCAFEVEFPVIKLYGKVLTSRIFMAETLDEIREHLKPIAPVVVVFTGQESPKSYLNSTDDDVSEVKITRKDGTTSTYSSNEEDESSIDVMIQVVPKTTKGYMVRYFDYNNEPIKSSNSTFEGSASLEEMFTKVLGTH